MRRSNKKEVIELIRQHIKECVHDDNYEEFPTFKKAASRLAAEFSRVANYPNNKHRIPNEQERFKDYMQGLPFSFEFMYYKQREVLNEWLQTEDDSRFSDQEVSDRYYYLIYRTIKNFIK